MMKMQEIIQEMGDKLTSDPEIVPALHCASGMTACTDLDFDQMSSLTIVASRRKMTWRTENQWVTSAGTEKQCKK